jgi:hypothetical protein
MQDNQTQTPVGPKRTPWNKGKLTGAKPPLRPKHVWSIRTKLQMADRKRDLALFNLAIDSKLRGLRCRRPQSRGLLLRTDTLLSERRFARRRPASRYGSRSPNKPGKRSMTNLLVANRKRGEFLFAAASAGSGPLDPTICASRRRLDTRHWARSMYVRYAFTAPDQGHADISPHRQSAGRPIAAWPYQDREHGSLSWYRGR